MITIQATTMSGAELLELQVEPSQLVKDVASALSTQLDVPTQYLQLIHESTPLSESGSLSSQGLNKDAKIIAVKCPVPVYALDLFKIQVDDACLVRYLLACEADPNKVDKRGGIDCTPLHAAVSRGFFQVAEQIVTSKGFVAIDEQTWGPKGFGPELTPYNTPLGIAVEKQHIHMVRLLLEARANVNAKQENNLTPIQMVKDVETANALLAARADAEVRGGLFKTPVIAAIFHCYHGDQQAQDNVVELVQVLINAKASVNTDNGEFDRSTPLHKAVKSENLELVVCLLNNGADVEAKDVDGRKETTPLWNAIAHKHSLGRRATYYATTPGPDHLMLRVERANNMGVVQALLGARANPNHKFCGNTPLGYAVSKKMTDVANALIVAGADVIAGSCPDGKSKEVTPLRWAVATGQQEMAVMLLEAKADVHEQDDLGRTPLHYASLKGSPPLVSSLLQAGGLVNACAKPVAGEEPTWSPLHMSHSAVHDGQLVTTWDKNESDVLVQLLIERGSERTTPPSIRVPTCYVCSGRGSYVHPMAGEDSDEADCSNCQSTGQVDLKGAFSEADWDMDQLTRGLTHGP